MKTILRMSLACQLYVDQWKKGELVLIIGKLLKFMCIYI